MLLNPRAWAVLPPEARAKILAKLPSQEHILDAGTENARPNIASLMNDNNFRHDCARYTENIGAGRHDPEWLRQAWIAQKKHMRGDFDEVEREDFKSQWGVELPSVNMSENGADNCTEGAQQRAEAQD